VSDNTSKESYPVLTYYTTCCKYTTKKWQQLSFTILYAQEKKIMSDNTTKERYQF